MSRWTTIVVVASVFLTLHHSEALIGYDCGRGSPNITSISLTEVGRCEVGSIEPSISRGPIQLLQRAEHRHTTVRQCRIKIDLHVQSCGMFSHTGAVDGGETTSIKAVTRELCGDMLKFGQFKYNNIVIDDLNVNMTNYRSITVAGSVKDNSDCSGETYVNNGHEYKKAVVTAKLEISLYEGLGIINPHKNEIVLSTGLKCPYSQGRCVDQDGTYAYWEAIPEGPCNFQDFVIIYEGEGAKVTDGTSDNRTLYFGNSTNNIQFGLAKTGEEVLCGYRLIKTEHPKLYILEASPGQGFTSQRNLEVQDVLQTAYFNTKIAYLAQHVKTQFDSLYKDILFHRCSLERQTLIASLSQVYNAPDLFALAIAKVPGFMAYPAGEAVHLVQCEPTACKVRLTTTCYEELPVTCGNESVYLKPRSRVIVRTGSPKDCNTILPNLFKLGDTWHRISPASAITNAPETLKPSGRPTWKYHDVQNFMESGIYTPEDLDRLREHMMFSAEKPAYLESVARKLAERTIPIGSNHFDKLIDQNAIESITHNTLNAIWGSFTKFGITCAGVLGIIMIFQFLKYILDTIVHGYTLYGLYGWSLHLLGALFGSVTQLLTHLAKSRRPAQPAPDAEAQPLDPATEQQSSERHPEPMQRRTVRYSTLPNRNPRSLEQLEMEILGRTPRG